MEQNKKVEEYLKINIGDISDTVLDTHIDSDVLRLLESEVENIFTAVLRLKRYHKLEDDELEELWDNMTEEELLELEAEKEDRISNTPLCDIVKSLKTDGTDSMDIDAAIYELECILDILSQQS